MDLISKILQYFHTVGMLLRGKGGNGMGISLERCGHTERMVWAYRMNPDA